jgi:hypothetical protein
LDKNLLMELQKRLHELKVYARADTSLSIEKFAELFQAVEALEGPTANYIASLSEAGTQHADLDALERARRKAAVIDGIVGVRNPAYFDQFAATLTEHPFALPNALFDPQGREIVTINFPNNIGRQQFYKERTDLALAILYPGSFTYRYGVPVKIETGQWSQTFVAELRMHTLSQNPIFKIERNGRTLDVYKPIMLRARQVEERNPFICFNCLSLAALDEGCFHSPQVKKPLKLPSSSPIAVNQEVQRKEGERIELRPPLNALISEVTYLPNLRVGTAVLGFERSAAGRVTIVDYNPPIGMIMETRGVAFQIAVPRYVLDQILQNRTIARDILIQILAKWISDLLSTNGMPSFHLEPILSGIIHSIIPSGGNIEPEALMDAFSKADWIDDAIESTMTEGEAYYERFNIQRDRLRTLHNALARRPLNENTLRNEVNIRIMHSLAHNLLIAGCVTSGCLPQDLEYLIRDDEVVLFDSADGGNGASEMIFEFCSSKESFRVTDTEEYVEKESIFSPKYFDEAFAELMLPCQQGVAERIFYRGLPPPGHQEMRRRILALERQRESYSDQMEYLTKIGVENAFTSSIGYQAALNLQLPVREAERLKEITGICLHGCPDCLVLGNKCDEGGFLERYNVSKVLLDEYFRFQTRDVVVDYSTRNSQIESLLGNRGVAILTGRVSNADDKVSERLRDKVAEFYGRKVGEKFVKFAGFWVDCPLNAHEVHYCAMLVLM